jgi:forkhead box protein K
MRTIPADDPLAEFLTTPPIVLDSNILILNPDVFAHLSSDQVKELEALGTRKALEILQGHIKRYLMERKKAKARAKAKKKKAKAAAAAAAGSIDGQVSGAPSGSTASASGTGAADLSMQAGLPNSISSKLSVPVPFNGSAPPSVVTYDPGSPIVIIDDDDEEDMQPQQPAAKRPRLDVPVH